MKTLYKIIFALGFVAFGFLGFSSLNAQYLETDSSYDYRPISTGPSGILPLKKLNVSGYYRFLESIETCSKILL